MQAAQASLYHDFSGLAALRRDARNDAASAVEPVARQFEAIFVQQMLKSMRDATPEGGLFNSSQLKSWQQMFDQQLSVDLADHGGLGLAQVLVEQLQAAGTVSGAAESGGTQAVVPPQGGQQGMALPSARYGSTAVVTGAALEAEPASTHSSRQQPSPAQPPLAAAGGPPAAPTPPEAFVRELWPLAEPAAAELGVDPAVLIAQAALETGWGQRALPAATGSSHNLFNIKAGSGWQGPVTNVQTVEYDGAAARLERAAFRVYDSPADSFADYVDLIRSAPRYQDALASAAEPEAYLRELQAAGYATDPAYADKILAILQRGTVADTVAELKNSAQLPPTQSDMRPEAA